jgi:cytochrome c6
MERSTEPHALPGWRGWGLALLALLVSVWVLWPRPVFGVDLLVAPPDLEARGASLFAQHCVGCHLNGGNVIRRGKTLRLAALKRAGLEGPEAIARVAALGQGQMGGYGTVLGEDGAQAVGAWVWSQALADWPKSAQKITNDPA